jgi:hemoglobin/transferrin/lactoferrin receptor protein
MFVSRLPALLPALLVWVSAPAFAKDNHPAALPQVTGGHGSSQFVRSWDDNGDGKVSRAEYEHQRVKRFAVTDTDKSEALSQDEYIHEYAARLDGQFAEEKTASIQQTDTRFRALDKDRDNFIARAEYDASGAKAFQHLDPDGDGRIGERDPKTQPVARASNPSVIRMPTTHDLAGFIEIHDTDGDGEVTREQFDAQRAASFTATDLDRNGKLDQGEYVKEFVARLDRQIETRRQDQLKQAGVRFKSIDNDKNGSITRAEYLAMSTRMFERADTNEDGVVSAADPTPPRRERDQDGPAVSAAAAGEANAPQAMGKIDVSADEEQSRSTVGNSTVIGSEQLEAEQAQNFEDAIRYVPGVNIVDLGRFGDNGFNIRGLEGDRVALTIDNLPLAEFVETTPAYEFFRAGRGSVDIDSLKSIEVAKGADSITAGSGALGGAVMLTTKDPADYLMGAGNDSYFRVKTGYTSSTDEMMTTATAVNRTGPIESMLLYTRRRGHEAESWYDSSPVAAGSERRTPDPIDRSSDNVLAKVNWLANDNHRLGIVGEYSRATNEIDNLSRVGGIGYLVRRADDDGDRDRYGVEYAWENDGTLFDVLEWSADRVQTESRALTTILAGSGCARNITPCLRSEDRATEQTLDRSALDLSKAWRSGGTSHSSSYGLAWQQREVGFSAVDTRYIGTTSDTSSVTVDPDQVPRTDVSNYTAYLRDTVVLLNDRLTVTAGMRYDRTDYSPRLDDLFVDETGTVRDVSFSAPTWQLNSELEFVTGHSAWVQAGSGFRAPSVAEMYAPTATTQATDAATGSPVVLWDFVANPDLEAEESLNTEIGYRWRSERHELGISAYQDKYTNFVEDTVLVRNADVRYRTCTNDRCTIVTGNEYLMPTNFGEVTVKGVEVAGRWAIDRQWSTRIAWAYSEGEKKNGDPLPSIVPATGVLGLRYASPSQRWAVTANVTHAEAKQVEDAIITETTDSFESLTPDFLSDTYTVFDLLTEIDVTKDVRLTAGIYNVADERYYLWPRVRFVNEGTTTLYGYASGAGIGRYSEPGRNFRVSLAWQF